MTHGSLHKMKRYLVFVLENLSEINGAVAVKASGVYLTNADNLQVTEEQAHALFMDANPSGSCEIFSIAEPFNILQPVTPGVDLVKDEHGQAPEGQQHDPETQAVGQYGITNKPHN